MKYFLWIKENQAGPYEPEQIRGWLQAGGIDADTLAYPEDGSSDWSPIKKFSDIVAAPSLTPPPPKPNEGISSYTTKTMQQDETPIYKTTLHKFIFVKYIVPACLIPSLYFVVILMSGDGSATAAFLSFLVAILLFGGMASIAAVIAYRTSECVITNRRVLIKVGLISRRTNEIFVSKIESIAVDQGIFGRLFDFGSVTVRGTGGSSDKFTLIAHPLEFRNHVQQIQSRTNG